MKEEYLGGGRLGRSGLGEGGEGSTDTIKDTYTPVTH